MAKLIETLPPDSVFEREYILMQSQGMERMISQFMAIHFTAWCNYRFLLPVTFLQDIAGRLGLEITPDGYERSTLCWRLENELRQIDTENRHPLHPYLQGEQAELKRFQLAGRLAHIFDQYQLMRPDMLRAWQDGQTVTNNSAEIWQMQLWKRLTSAESVGRHRGELLQKVAAVLHEADPKKTTLSSLPRRISVFGIHILPPFFLDCLSGLARHCDVHLFLLSPCRTYWGDMDRRQDLSAMPLEITGHHPLLASLGKQGRDFQELLLEKMVIEKEFVSYEDPMESGQGTLLQQLQAGLLNGGLSERGGGRETATGAGKTASDASLRFVSCHSKKRELDVLRDHILHMLDCDNELQLCDIVVMAPDIQQYAPYISAVFGDIRHSIADRSLSRRNRYLSVFVEFLEIFSGRFGWSELLDLLEKKEISSQFDIFPSDFDRLRNWVVGAGIRWGLSSGSRKTEGLRFSENSWQEGLERLLMGCAIDVEEEVAGVLPYSDIEGGAANILGGLCAFIALLEEARDSFSNGRRLEQWSVLLQDFAGRLFGHGEDRTLQEFYEILRQPAQYGEFHDGTVSFEVVRQWLQNSSRESRSASGFLKGRLTFCSMLPMRSIPFKAICLIGMNYGVFPAADPITTFDLLRSKPLPGDRSLRTDDRYQFLEVLLSARQSLYISYIGQSLHNNDVLPPSVVVTELLEVVEKYDGVSARVEKHPLHSFSARYFNGSDKLYSYSEQDLLVAMARRREEQEHQWWSGRLEAVDCQSIEVDDLFRFYRHPQLYFIQQCLEVSLEADREDPEESEVFQSSGLQKYGVNQMIFAKMDTAKEALQLQKRLRSDGLWPLGTPGELFFEEKRKEMARFVARIEDEQMGERLPDVVVDLRVGPYHLGGMLGNRYEGGFMSARYGDLRGKDLLGGWLRHRIGALCGINATKIIMKDRRVAFGPEELPGPGLREMIEVYLRGRQEPCKLLLEPAMVYCRQQRSGRARISPLQKAMDAFTISMENGYEPAWSLLYGKSEIQTVLDQNFVALSEQLLCPLWSGLS